MPDQNITVKKHANPAIIILATALLAFIAGYGIYMALFSSRSPQAAIDGTDESTAGSGLLRTEMYIVPGEISTATGDEFTITVVADTRQEQVNGIDAVVQFDPAYLEAVSVDPADGTPPSFSLMRNLIEDDLAVSSLVRIVFDNEAVGTVPVADITFRARAPGRTSLILDHQPGTTRGSTVIEATGSANILDRVVSATVIIE